MKTKVKILEELCKIYLAIIKSFAGFQMDKVAAGRVKELESSLSALEGKEAITDEEIMTYFNINGLSMKVPSMTRNDVIVMIRHFESRMQSAAPTVEWISVKESLPKQASFVIVHKSNGIVCGMYYNADYEFMYSDSNQSSQITHWMPLPTFANNSR